MSRILRLVKLRAKMIAAALKFDRLADRAWRAAHALDRRITRERNR